MLKNLSVNTFLGYLGLTKNDAINVAISAITRRVYISGFNESDSYELPAAEVQRILKDSTYRKMLSKSGKGLRKKMFDKRELGTLLLDALSEHSVTLRTLSDQLSYGSEGITIDEDTVNLAVGELVKIVGTVSGMGPEREDNQAAPLEHTPASQIIGNALKACSNGTTIKEIFPDIHELLTHRDNDNPLLQ